MALRCPTQFYEIQGLIQAYVKINASWRSNITLKHICILDEFEEYYSILHYICLTFGIRFMNC